MFACPVVLPSMALALLCAMPYLTLQLQLNGCGPEHNDVTLCDYAAVKVNKFPTEAFTISMWVKASAPHEKDKFGEGEALFSYNTDRTIANAKYVYRSSEVGIWMYRKDALLFTLSDGTAFAYAWADAKTDNTTGGCKEWCHFAFTWQKDQPPRTYHSGTLLETGYSNYGVRIQSDGAIMIGNRGKEVYPKGFPPGRPAVERQYRGDIQDVRIYERRLDAGHIKDVMKGYLGPSIESSLTFYWTLFGYEYLRQRTENQECVLNLHGNSYANICDEEAPVHKYGLSNIHQPATGLVSWPQHNFYSDIDAIFTVQILELESQLYGKDKGNDSSKKTILSIKSLQAKEISSIQSSPNKIFDGRGGQIIGKGTDTKITSFLSEGLQSKKFVIPLYAKACSENRIGGGGLACTI